MKSFGFLIFGLASALLASGSPASAQSKETELRRLPVSLETELAKSAIQPHLREEAGVYLLNPEKGYEKKTESENGFSCFVGRTDLLRLHLKEYRDDLLVPVCFDAIGTDSIMKAWFDVAELRAHGNSPTELFETIKENYDLKRYKEPGGPGYSPMISPILRTYGADAVVDSYNYPHYMFYAPHVSPEAVGSIPAHARYPWVDQADYPAHAHAYIMYAAGAAEKAEINIEHKDLLKKPCEHRSEYCMANKVNQDLKRKLLDIASQL